MKRKTLALFASAVCTTVVCISSADAQTYDLTSFPYGTVDQNATGVTAGYGPEACAPASTANSLAMLQAKYGIMGLTQPAGGGQSSGVNTINSLITAMGTQPKTAMNPGTTDPNMITGKINYINSQGLSDKVKVEYQSANTTTANRNTSAAMGSGSTIPTLAFIAQQLAAGQDVEMGFNWIDGAGNISGGHWVTLDYYDVDTGTLGFLDPWNPTAGGGALQLMTRTTGTYTLAAPYGADPAGAYIDFTYAGGAAGTGTDPDNPDGATEAFVDVVVAESPVPEPMTGGLLLVAATIGSLGRRRRLTS